MQIIRCLTNKDTLFFILGTPIEHFYPPPCIAAIALGNTYAGVLHKCWWLWAVTKSLLKCFKKSCQES